MKSNWFEIEKVNEHLFVIRERLDLIESKFLTKYTNLYLIIGSKSVLLLDTGSGIGNLKGVVDQIIKSKELIVINSHNHFDHVLGNCQFNKIHIHRLDFLKLMKPFNIDFLRKIDNVDIKMEYSKYEFQFPMASEHIPLMDGDLFDLGDISVEVLHTPGHTPGSISLLTNLNELFTGDTIHYGSIYLPPKIEYNTYLETLNILYQKIEGLDNLRIYPGHETFNHDLTIFDKLLKELRNREFFTHRNGYNHFLDAYVIKTAEFNFVYES